MERDETRVSIFFIEDETGAGRGRLCSPGENLWDFVSGTMADGPLMSAMTHGRTDPDPDDPSLAPAVPDPYLVPSHAAWADRGRDDKVIKEYRDEELCLSWVHARVPVGTRYLFDGRCERDLDGYCGIGGGGYVTIGVVDDAPPREIRTPEDIYALVRGHLLGQGARSVGPAGCAYRGSGLTACAVGCLIPDGLYDPVLEGRPARALAGVAVMVLDAWTDVRLRRALSALQAALPDVFGPTNVRLLTQLQCVHDMGVPSQWPRLLPPTLAEARALWDPSTDTEDVLMLPMLMGRLPPA